jgi:hypothetical protein
MVRKIVHRRWEQRLGAVQMAGGSGMPAPTVYAVLTRCRLSRLAHLDRVTGEPVRRYEHGRPGAMLHVDVNKCGSIPDGRDACTGPPMPSPPSRGGSERRRRRVELAAPIRARTNSDFPAANI